MRGTSLYGVVLFGALCGGCQPDRVIWEAPPGPAGDAFVVDQIATSYPTAPLRLGFGAPEVPFAIDPKLPGFPGATLRFPITSPIEGGLVTCRVAIEREGELVRSIDGRLEAGACTASWDGRAWDERFASVGAYAIKAMLLQQGTTLSSTVAPLTVVRVGVAEVQLEGMRVPLLYRALDDRRRGYYELPKDEPPFRLGPDQDERPQGSALDLADGTPRVVPAIWDSLTTPPLDEAAEDGVEHEARSLPVAIVAGSEAQLAATVITDAPGLMVRVVPPNGARLLGDGTGTELQLAFENSPAPNVGRYDLALDFGFEVRAGEGEWSRIPGAFTVPVRVYGLVGEPTMEHTAIPHRPWVDVVDEVATWVGGTTRDPEMVAARIVEGVYYELGLEYDVQHGASAYTEYQGDEYEDAVFGLSWFLDRTFGDVINCTDAASIVSTYANMMGVDMRYQILLHREQDGFDLNYIQAIGGDEFTETPFVTGRGGFSYHAVVEGPGDAIYDATLALDGDGEPTAAPFTLLLAQGLVPEDYLRALSSEWDHIGMYVDQQVEVR